MVCKLSGGDASASIFVNLREHLILEEKVLPDLWLCGDPHAAEITESSSAFFEPELRIEIIYTLITMGSMANSIEHTCYIYDNSRIISTSMLSKYFSQFIDFKE